MLTDSQVAQCPAIYETPDTFKNWFMLSVRILSYGCTWDIWRAQGSARVARGVAKSNSSFLSALRTSQVHP